MSLHLEDVLKKLGWDDGFQIPIANAENKALEEEVAKLSLRKVKSKNALDRASTRLQALQEHFKFVNQENDQTQKLITAHRQQYESVEHQFHVIRAEKDSVEYDIKQTMKQLNELEERRDVKKVDLQKGIAKAETLKTETDWDVEALKAWEESLKKRDDDIELIKKFSREDERKYNELEARRQLLRDELMRNSNIVVKMVSECSNYENILQRTGKVIKQLTAEREALITQWKDTVKMLQQRDNDIAKAQEQVSTTHELIEKQQEKLEDENNFLRNERRNNHEIELEISNLTALNSRLRKEYNDVTQYLLLLNSELQSLKHEVASSAQHLENERLKRKHINQTISNKEMLCEKYKLDIEKIHAKLEEMKGSSMSAEERINKIEKLIEIEEKQYNVYLMDTEKINNTLFRHDRLLKEQKDIGRLLAIEINNVTCHCNQLRKHIRTAKKELEKIKEVVYDMEFRIDDFEQKLCKLEGVSKQDDHSDEKEKEIQALEQVLADHKEVHHTLLNQVERLQKEMRRLTNLIALDKAQLDTLQEKCEHFMITNEISKKQIAAAKQATQEKQVEENMMRLRINHIENDMKREDKQIFSLEKLRLHLDQAMKERQVDIDASTQILQAKRRNLEEDRGRLRADIALHRLKIEQFQKKYHITLMSLGKDEDGQPLSVTHFKIRNAQEKFMLQNEGDELDQKIKTAEKEIVAMENTLKLVNLTNSAFKNSLSQVKDDDQEVQEMKLLEEQLREINYIYKEHKRELASLQEELEDVRNKLKEVENDRNRNKEIAENLEEELQLIQKQESEKAEKLQRAECQLKKLTKKIGKKDISKYDRDFEIRQLRDANKYVLQKLVEMYISYQEMAPRINRYTLEQNIQLPERKVTPSTSSTSSLSLPSACSSQDKQSNTRLSQISQLSSTLNKINLQLDL